MIIAYLDPWGYYYNCTLIFEGHYGLLLKMQKAPESIYSIKPSYVLGGLTISIVILSIVVVITMSSYTCDPNPYKIVGYNP